MAEQNSVPRILVVEASRMARAMFVRQLKDAYDCREEADGEAAWQVLVLDHRIDLVICALSLPVLDGNGLIQRLRASKLPRLSKMPMLMVVGDDADALERAKNNGASDFVHRSTSNSELLVRVESLLKLSLAQRQLQDSFEALVQNPETGLFTRKYIELQAAQAMSHVSRHGGYLSVLVLGFRDFGRLREEFGAEAMEVIQRRFIAMLTSKVRKEDSLGHYSGSLLSIVSPGTSLSSCASFARRLQDAIASANIVIKGQKVPLVVDVGVASSPDDTVVSAGALIELAVERMRKAILEDFSEAEVADMPPCLGLDDALRLLAEGRGAVVRASAPQIASRLLPLLQCIDQELELGLSFDVLAERILGAHK